MDRTLPNLNIRINIYAQLFFDVSFVVCWNEFLANLTIHINL